MSRARVTALSFSPVARDGRVLRQARALADGYAVTLLGHATPERELPADLASRVRFVPLAPPERGSRPDRAAKALWLAFGRVAPEVGYPRWYWRYAQYRRAADALAATAPDLVVANDWYALPAAARVADAIGASLLADLHEYAPRQWEHRRRWRWLWRPAIDFFLHATLPRAGAVVTVSPSHAAAYEREYGVRCDVVRNVPEAVGHAPPTPCDPERIRLVHHGVAGRERRLERTVEAVVRAGPRFHLDLMLVPGEAATIASLGRLAASLAPDRIRVRAAVPPDGIVEALASYDAGIMIIPPTTFNYVHALPNKFFEVIAAGLAAFTAPSPDMAAFVREHGCGAVSDGFEADDMARLLAGLTAADVDRYKANSRRARDSVNAASEARTLLRAADRALAARGGARRPRAAVDPRS